MMDTTQDMTELLQLCLSWVVIVGVNYCHRQA